MRGQTVPTHLLVPDISHVLSQLIVTTMRSSFTSSIDEFIACPLCARCVPGSMLGPEDRLGKERDKCCAHQGCIFRW